MQEAQGMRLDSPIFKSGALAIVGCGILGAFVAGYMSDKVFGAPPPVAFIGYAAIIVAPAVIMGGPSLTMLIVAFSLNSLCDLDGALDAVGHRLDGLRRQTPRRPRPACWTACSTWAASSPASASAGW